MAGAACVGMLGLVALCTWWVSRACGGFANRGVVTGAVRDVAIVPGTFVANGRPGPLLRSRLDAALSAFRQGHVRDILVSGNEASGEVTVMRAWLERMGVDPARIVADPSGTRTIETMRNAARRFHVSTAVVCTQEISMDRALYLARENGIDAVGLTADRDLPHDLRWKGTEALKSTLAVVETALP
jgi:vancomycin permeability regulator SanA